MSKPAASTLKSRRRRKPVFVDEPIQWHLSNPKHDRCPWCGLPELESAGRQKRICLNHACAITVEIQTSPEKWAEAKARGETPLVNGPGSFTVVAVDEHYDLAEARMRSETGRARLAFRNSLFSLCYVFWHREAHAPEDVAGRRCVAPGSPYWKRILELKGKSVWYPDEPLNAMEVIARAYGTDEPMFAIMSG